jgi:hypothetical protein
MRKLKELTKEEELEIVFKRQNGIKRKDIINEYGISDRHYKKVIIDNGGIIKNKAKKYNLNEDYFEKIDTEDKAYFLGFIVADGNISNRNPQVTIIQKETDILYKFKEYIKFEGNIFTKNDGSNCSSLTVTSEKMKTDLFNLGIYPAKTMIIRYPEIPKNLEHHFMRGVFDGDGCISIHKKREGSRDTSDRGQVNICSGSKDFIEVYVDKLVDYCGITRNKIRCPKGTYSVIDWGSFSDIERFYEFFYKDATIYLDRKKETFDRAISISKTKIKYRKS